MSINVYIYHPIILLEPSSGTFILSLTTEKGSTQIAAGKKGVSWLSKSASQLWLLAAVLLAPFRHLILSSSLNPATLDTVLESAKMLETLSA